MGGIPLWRIIVSSLPDTMASRSLTLVFPQWQGSGKQKYVYDGARLIAGLLPAGTPYEEVPVSLDDELSLERGIWGYRQISGQLSAAGQIIGRAGPDKIFLVGGDCGTEVAPVSYLNQRYDGDLAVLWLDAHGDLNSPSTSVTHNFHGMPLRCLLGECEASLLMQCFSTLRPSQVVMGGTRELDPPEAEYLERNGISVLTVSDLEAGAERVSRAIAATSSRHLYVHIDLDVLDSEKCPWGLCRTPDGIDVGVLMGLLRELKARFDVVGVSIVELKPREGMDIRTLRELVNIAGDL
ncbi:MAG: formimidoylglutamase [Methanocella sp. PtaU1.Bin125]|nr:MAG: formimidoylglutamase [Methanocella sp. PtaU1.Bin125]